MNTLQTKIDKVFKECFGYTPLNERLEDIQREFFELMKWNDVKNLKEESGDLLCSLIELHTENDWSIDENIEQTLEKILRRKKQYKSLGRKTKVAIYGGAFDPITKGHLQVAQFILNTSGEFDEVWLMPANGHMYNKKMANANHRIKMCELAAKVDSRIKIFDYEIANELAGETFNFVKRLKEEKELTEKYNFSIVIGSDNAITFDKWVNYEMLERMIRFVVVPRAGYTITDPTLWCFKDPHIFLNGENNPIMDVSSTLVRNHFKNIDTDDSGNESSEFTRKSLEMLDPEVYYYILDNNLYI